MMNALALKLTEINKLKDVKDDSIVGQIKVPKYQVLPIDKLEIPSYQREPKFIKSKKMSDNLDLDLIGVILVSYRERKLWIIDGQHRVNALKLSGIKYVLCQVLDNLSIEEESDKYLKLNTLRTPLNSNQKFIAKLEANDVIANDIVKILSNYGVSYTTNNGIRENGKIACLSSCEYAYKKVGAVEFENIFKIIKKVWNNRASSLHVQIIRGISSFIDTHKEYYNINILIQALKDVEPQFIIFEGSQIAENRNNLNDSPCVHIAKIMWNEYNKKAKELNKKEIPYMF